MQHEHGITMIEVVVTMVIIGIMAAIMVPSFGAARTIPADRLAQSVAHSLSEAVIAFQRDHEGRVPDATSTPPEWSPEAGPLDAAGSDSRPYTPRAARQYYLDPRMQLCLAAVDAPTTPDGHTCATRDAALSRVVYVPIRGAAPMANAFRIDVYTRKDTDASFTVAGLLCSTQRLAIEPVRERSEQPVGAGRC